MKKEIRYILIGLIFAVGIVLYLPATVTAKEVKPEEIIRLHVIANSDEKKDQELKLKVRDEIVNMLQPTLLKAKDRNDAEKILVEHLSEIEEIAQSKVDSEGFSYPVKAVIGDFNFPIKAYNNFIAPAGEYRALKVIIGQGVGANWWCVMFPPICLVDLKHQVTSNLDKAVATTDINSISIKSEETLPKTKETLTKKEVIEEVNLEPEVEIEVRFKIVELWHSLTKKLNSLF